MPWFLPGFLLPVHYPGDSGGKLKYYCMAGNLGGKKFWRIAESMTFDGIYFGGIYFGG